MFRHDTHASSLALAPPHYQPPPIEKYLSMPMNVIPSQFCGVSYQTFSSPHAYVWYVRLGYTLNTADYGNLTLVQPHSTFYIEITDR